MLGCAGLVVFNYEKEFNSRLILEQEPILKLKLELELKMIMPFEVLISAHD